MSKLSSRQSSTGFTLIELIVSVVIVGVLFSIAAPGWLAFANRQRANNVRDQIFQTLQRTQSDAIRTKQAQFLKIDTAANPPTLQVVALRTPLPNDTVVTPLGNNQLQPGMITLLPPAGDLSVPDTGSAIGIGFNSEGYLLNDVDVDTPIKLTVAVPNSTVKSCVIVQTILGRAITESGSGCD